MSYRVAAADARVPCDAGLVASFMSQDKIRFCSFPCHMKVVNEVEGLMPRLRAAITKVIEGLARFA